MAGRGLLALLLVLGAAFVSRAAGAYCPARTCDPADPAQACDVDHHGCVTTGSVLHWPASCTSFAVQRDGSAKSGLDAAAVTLASVNAFHAWLGADCGGEKPSIVVGLLPPVACDQSRYDPDGKNANIVMFRDDAWPYPGSGDTYGLTIVRFAPASGEILDADIEVNSADFDLTADGGGRGTDLQSILTHELGHFLGLAHTKDETATMRATWDGKGLDLRTLASDDEAGICAEYAPGGAAASSCLPINGFASDCNVPKDEPSADCSLAIGAPARAASNRLAAFLLFGAILARAWRRSPRRPPARTRVSS